MPNQILNKFPTTPSVEQVSIDDRITESKPNPITESISADKAAETEQTVKESGIKSDLKPARPVDLPNDPAVEKTAAEVVGRKLTMAEQIAFLNNLDPEMLALFGQRVAEHMKEAAAAEQKRPPKYIQDFSTIREQDVFNLDVSIQAIDHQTPEYMNVELKDANFVPRWIQTSAVRLGQAKAQGWGYVSKEDLAQALAIEIEENSEGHFIYSDVVLMKCTKQKVYTQIRANFQRAIAISNPGKLHERMRKAIESEIESATDSRGLPLHDAFHKYKESGAISTYAPLAK